MSKYLCIAGHGRRVNGSYDPGAIGIVGGEHKYMKDKLFPAMKKYAGNDFIFHTENNVYSHKSLARLANKYGKDTKVIEFHYDAFSKESAKGGHVIIHSMYSPDKMDLRLRDLIKKHFGIRYSHRGHAGISGRSNLANVNIARNKKINYRLLELGFGTNRSNANELMNNTDALARGLVEAIQNKPISTNDKVKIRYKGKLHIVDGYLKDGSNYVKLRDTFEALGYKVDWDSKKREVIIK